MKPRSREGVSRALSRSFRGLSAAMLIVGVTASLVAVDKDKVIEITFSDVNMNMMADMVFRDFLLTDRVRQLEGKRVRVSGVMFSEGDSLKTDEFYLLKNKECKFGRGGQADHLFTVKIKDNKKVKVRVEMMTVEGTFHLNPVMGADGNTWSVFDLLDAVAK